MFIRKKKIIFAAILTASSLYASTFFSGYAGGKINFQDNPLNETGEFDPDLTMQAFFAGQFSFSQNTWAHLEMSIDTEDLLTENILDTTTAKFRLDEFSYIIRGNLPSTTNYFSAFMGTYDPVGSDIFLQRYFSIEPIASKLTESYMGLSGSVLYPQFGAGVADIIRLHSSPMAFGMYAYVNKYKYDENNILDDSIFTLNTDLRYANVFRYFTCDFAAGLGIPLKNEHNGEDVLVAVDKLYFHAGTTLLFGNNYTNAMFIQAGINAPLINKDSQNEITISPEKLYLLLEPRFVLQNFHIIVSAYSFPKNTAERLLFVDDEDFVGADLHMYSANIMIGNLGFTIGGHLSFSVPKTLNLIIDHPDEMLQDGYNLNVTPYVTLPFLSGELHIQGKVKIMDIANNNAQRAFSADLGYRARL